MTTGAAPNSTDTIVLIHGLWMTSLSWERWVEHSRQAGYQVIAPAYPGLDVGIEALRKDPSAIEKLTIAGTADHYARIIRELDRPPVLVGHSFGGTLVQLMLDRGLGAVGIAIDSVPVKGVKIVPFSQVKASLPVLGHISTRHKAVPLTLKQFEYAFTNACTDEQSRQVYERYHIPAPGRIVWDGVLANLSAHPATEVDFGKPDRAPLLLIAGGADHIMPPSVNSSNFEHYKQTSGAVVGFKEFPGRCHYTLGQDGWQDVADFALTWAEHPVAGVIN